MTAAARHIARPRQRLRAVYPCPAPRRGMGAVAVIVVLVAMAVMAAAVLRLSVQAGNTAQQDVGATRAAAAARSGLEWGLYQALKGSWTNCSGASQTLDLRADTGMRVTVSCSATTYNEGETVPGTPATVRLFTLDAVACNGSSTCPDATAAVRQGYVERRMQTLAVN